MFLKGAELVRITQDRITRKRQFEAGVPVAPYREIRYNCDIELSKLKKLDFLLS